MRAVIHVGMPKTGSTVIQASFHGLRRPGLEYLEAPGINHFRHLVMLFEDDASGQPGEPHGPASPVGQRGRRERARRTLDQQIERVRSRNGTLILSSEALWANARGGLLRAVLRDLADRGVRVQGLAYLRAPLAQATSAFQQRLKHLDRPPLFGLDPVWPRFREPIAGLDRSFGTAALELRAFRGSGSAPFDVVADFASALGIPAPPKAPRANPALSAEATAVLYAARRRVPCIDMSGPRRRQTVSALIEGLRLLGQARLSFAEGLWRPLAARHAEDQAWAEARLGARLDNEPDAGRVVIASERELLDLAQTHAGTDQAQAFNEGLDRLASRPV